MPTTIRITQNNKKENKKARQYLEKYPDAVVGNINYYHDNDKEIKNLKDVMPLLNFSYAWATPQKDEILLTLIKNYNTKEGTYNLVVAIDKILTRIDKLDGINFNWI